MSIAFPYWLSLGSCFAFLAILPLAVPENRAVVLALAAILSGTLIDQWARCGARQAKFIVDKEHPVTILMCDLVDSTRLSSSMQIPDFRSLLLCYYDTSSQVIEGFQGRVIRVVGDGILAVFGERGEHPQVAAHNAVCAALALRTRVPDIDTTPWSGSPTQLAARMAVVSGVGIITPLKGTGQDVVFGELPFVAERLKSKVNLNQIVTNDATATMLNGEFHIESLGYRQLKGFPQHVRAWRVLDPIDAAAAAPLDKLMVTV